MALGTLVCTAGLGQLTVDMSCVRVDDQGYAAVTWDQAADPAATLSNTFCTCTNRRPASSLKPTVSPTPPIQRLRHS